MFKIIVAVIESHGDALELGFKLSDLLLQTV